MTIGEVIKAYRAKHRLSQGEFGQRAGGYSAMYISRLERNENLPDRKPMVPSSTALIGIAKAMNISLNELVEMLDDDQMITTRDVPEEHLQPLPEMTRVPIVGRIACGTPIFAQENLQGWASMPKDVRADFSLVAVGDSMIGARIHDGDLVFIRQQPEVENGEIAAVLIGEEATLKRVYLQPGRLTLVAENPAYPPMVYVGEELNDVRILGKAISAMISLEVRNG